MIGREPGGGLAADDNGRARFCQWRVPVLLVRTRGSRSRLQKRRLGAMAEKPDKPDHPDHPDHPEHPEHPEHPDVPPGPPNPPRPPKPGEVG